MAVWIVTGGAGFIGGNFVHRALELGHEVVNVDALTYAGHLETVASAESNPHYRFVHADIRDAVAMSNLLEHLKPDAVINFAAESHVDRSIDSPRGFFDTNVMGVLSLCEASLKYWRGLDDAGRERFRFLQVSTDEVFGTLGAEGKFTEETPFAPNSPYSASKASADHVVRSFHHTFGLPTLTTNCSNNYGPYQLPEKLIPLMIAHALAGKRLPVYGTGENVRDWLYVTDHCDAIMRVLQDGRAGETYNVGGNAERTNLEVVRAICSILDEIHPLDSGTARESLIEFVTDRPGHDLRYAVDISRIQREIGWSPSVNFEEGLRRTISWYLANQDWVAAVSEDESIGARLGGVAGTTDGVTQ